MRLLLAFALLTALAPAQTLPKMFEIPLLDCSGFPCLEMQTSAGKTMRLLIDLAQANAYLDTKAAQSLALELKPLTGAAASGIQQTIVPGAKLGELPLGDFPFMVLDASTQPSDPKDSSRPLPADGALTYRAFANRILQIDYPRHMLRISEPQTTALPCPGNCGPLAVKHFGQFGPVTLVAIGFELNGQPVDAQIDTLFPATMLIYPAAAEKLGLKKAKKEKGKDFFPFLQSGLHLVHADGASESYRGVALSTNAPVYFTASDQAFPNMQFDATVGGGLLSHAVVTFDFKGMRMWVELPGAIAPARPASTPSDPQTPPPPGCE